jgi:uncharacterized membrane protein YphA (DoxX/SURF4 family)
MKNMAIKLSDKAKRTAANVITYSFMLLFLYAAFNKLLGFEKFKAQMGQSAMLTDYAAILAWAVPVVEIVVAALLMVPKTLKIGLYASFMLMVVFSVYIIVILNFAAHVPCGCGGILQNLSWKNHLAFNLFFVGLAWFGVWLQTKLNENSA